MSDPIRSSRAGDPDALTPIQDAIADEIGPDVDYLKAQENYRPHYHDLVLQAFSSDLWNAFIAAGLLAIAQPTVEGVVRQAGSAVGKMIREGLERFRNSSSAAAAAETSEPLATMAVGDKILDAVMQEAPEVIDALVEGGTVEARGALERRGFPPERAAELAAFVAGQVRQRAAALRP